MPDCFYSATFPERILNRLAGRFRRIFAAPTIVVVAAMIPGASVAADLTGAEFRDKIQPILEDRCYSCHGNGNKKGGVDLDGTESNQARLHDRNLWLGVLKNVRAGIMPPAGKPQPSSEERRALEDWIKFGAFGIDPKDPDPGRVTVRRLNRVEYRNTIRDLIGVDYDTTGEFPPDDTGYGFDNIGDVLTLSPLLLEKYLAAASDIISRAVPTVPKVVARQVIPGQRFRRPGAAKDGHGPPSLSYYEPATLSASVPVEHDGRYKVVLEITASERFVDGVNDYNRCRFYFRVDGEEVARREFVRQDGKPFRFEADRDWKAGPHALTVEIEPLTPKEKQVRSLTIRVQSATIVGPSDEKYWVQPTDYARFFPRAVPDDAEGRRLYAREILGQFASRAFRRPVDDATSDRLAALACAISAQKGQTFEAGVAQAMAAVMTSPRFLFREEDAEPGSTDRFPLVDEYGLASRLSYFLWSSMPDDELIRLAGDHKLRANLSAQVARMLADKRSAELFRHFVGQWLQSRDIEDVLINTAAVITRDQAPDPEAESRRRRFRELIQKPAEKLTDAEKKELQEARASFGQGFRRFREFELTGELRRAMRSETEMLFEHIVRGNRSLLEVLDCNYTFLNEKLAKHYGIGGVKGDQMQLVTLPAGSPRGGVLTQGTILAVTSNPDRTSPVKRGLFILDNILGSPPAPPPPNIPSLEEAGKKVSGRTPSAREAMVLHRSQPTCASCHARMDPLGLALENFNALGRWRDRDRSGPVDASGTLLTGESFKEIRELKQILVERRRRDFYRCLSEKMLIYALGRGLESYDVQAADTIVERIEKANGGASGLISGIVESVPFQKRRRSSAVASAEFSDRGTSQTSGSDATK
jgi:Protein of unknown function (DUF1592)/Protein of unknown function (DUF1588)/Protein of unknown function (DUF1587)/Protein of unknown function (DUF1585)/Protein of unknown function (DUF1595)/Cytochrome C oxidase, cbb3-type, subunit III